jgi:hypothetical protein
MWHVLRLVSSLRLIVFAYSLVPRPRTKGGLIEPTCVSSIFLGVYIFLFPPSQAPLSTLTAVSKNLHQKLYVSITSIVHTNHNKKECHVILTMTMCTYNNFFPFKKRIGGRARRFAPPRIPYLILSVRRFPVTFLPCAKLVKIQFGPFCTLPTFHYVS